MGDRATPGQLLQAARAMCDELAELLPADKVHYAVMIASALAIVERQLHEHGADPEAELAAARGVVGGCDTVEQCERTLCRWIREGRADSGEIHALVWRYLRETTERRVAESNPRYLDSL
jgi:hypothetical protein